MPEFLVAAGVAFGAIFVAVLIGRQLGERLPTRAVRIGSAGLFGAVGAIILLGAALP